jgi:hypothetical protein
MDSPKITSFTTPELCFLRPLLSFYFQLASMDFESLMRVDADEKQSPSRETERDRLSGVSKQASEPSSEHALARKLYVPSPTYYPTPLATFVKEVLYLYML